MEKYILDMKGKTLSDAEVLQTSDDDYEAVLSVGPSPDAFDDHDDGAIDTDLWAASGSSNSEGALFGKDCIQIAGPASPAWDSDGVIYKPAVVPSTGSVIMGQVLVDGGGFFGIGLQEYSFTVDDVDTPTAWTLKLNEVQTVDNSTYLVFEPGRVVIYRGGLAGERKIISDSSWVISETDIRRPIYFAFVFSTNGFQIYLNQPSVWDSYRLVHEEVRSNNTLPTEGYSLCINKNYSDNILGFYGLCSAFETEGTIDLWALAESSTSRLQASSLSTNYEIGGMLGQSGSITVQIPEVSPQWQSLSTLANSNLVLTGEQAYKIRVRMAGDATINHPVTISEVTE